MARKNVTNGKNAKETKDTKSTSVRNSAIPKSAAKPFSVQPSNRGSGSSTTLDAPRGRQVTHEMIARRAYEIYRSGKGASDFENWCRAERELRAGF